MSIVHHRPVYGSENNKFVVCQHLVSPERPSWLPVRPPALAGKLRSVLVGPAEQ